jgi:hypothetical protein
MWERYPRLFGGLIGFGVGVLYHVVDTNDFEGRMKFQKKEFESVVCNTRLDMLFKKHSNVLGLTAMPDAMHQQLTLQAQCYAAYCVYQLRTNKHQRQKLLTKADDITQRLHQPRIMSQQSSYPIVDSHAIFFFDILQKHEPALLQALKTNGHGVEQTIACLTDELPVLSNMIFNLESALKSEEAGVRTQGMNAFVKEFCEKNTQYINNNNNNNNNDDKNNKEMQAVLEQEFKVWFENNIDYDDCSKAYYTSVSCSEQAKQKRRRLLDVSRTTALYNPDGPDAM